MSASRGLGSQLKPPAKRPLAARALIMEPSPKVTGPTPKWRVRVGRVDVETVDASGDEAVPPGVWSGRLPLRHCQRGWNEHCDLCDRGATEGHLMSAGH